MVRISIKWFRTPHEIHFVVGSTNEDRVVKAPLSATAKPSAPIKSKRSKMMIEMTEASPRNGCPRRTAAHSVWLRRFEPISTCGIIFLYSCFALGCSPSSSSTDPKTPEPNQNVPPQTQTSNSEFERGLQNNPTLRQLAEQPVAEPNGNETRESISTPQPEMKPTRVEGSVEKVITNRNQGSLNKTAVPANLSPEKLIEFLSVVDRDMQDVWGRMQQVEGGRKELIRIAKMKLQAAKQLKSHTDASESQKSLGARGELQALSHLASFNDVESARTLRKIAESNLLSNDTSLASDSRLVLIGFALENLKQGNENAKSDLMKYVATISKAIASNDVPTLMVLGQARDTLAAYGEQDLAANVRDKILELYQDSPNPDLRAAANELANHVYYDEIETLLASARNGAELTLGQWESSIKKLVDQANDMNSAQYLSSAALQLEGLQRLDLVSSTFRILREKFSNSNAEVAREVEIASTAYQARQNIIGTDFKFDLPLINNESLRTEEYEKKITLMPFWTVALPESLQLIQFLESIRDKHPTQVAILGINLDVDDQLLEEFMRQNKLPFQNLKAKSMPENQPFNEIATRFGVTSMPFLAIIDSNQRVAAINFTGQGIEETVTRLIKENASALKNATEAN